jgi:Pyruvate/2-oxoacid:ferredoxin oxidoreductase delta subunit
MEQKLERLEEIIDRLKDDEEVSVEELREIAQDLETGKKYRCATCQMFCTGEDVMVIFNTETEEFLQIEVPMDESEDLIITRAN